MTLVQAQIHRRSALALFLEYDHPEGDTAILVPIKGENHFETGKRNLSVLIRIGYEIVLRLFNPSPVIFLLRVHPSRRSLLMAPEDFHVEPDLPVQYYRDSFGIIADA
jgi:hypothetical protein